MAKNLRARTLFAMLTLAAISNPTFAAAQNPPLPTTQFIETAPFMNLQLNLETKFVAGAGNVLAQGQPLVRYDVTPRTGVRLLGATAARIGTYPPSVPAQTVLFEVGLGNGKGYCAPLTVEQGVRNSQCFIDINSDNKFDASYLTDDAWQGKTLYWGQVSRLASIPPIAYEPVDALNIPAEPMSFYFKRVRNNLAEFQMALGPRNNGVPARKCAMDGQAMCRMGRHNFVFQAQGTSVKVVSVSLASDQLDIITMRYN
jgi:hypothetical protein